jgi:predicted GNAT family N-acyltransferase
MGARLKMSKSPDPGHWSAAKFCLFSKTMALKIIEHGSEEYRQMVTLRHDILRKPLGLDFDQQELDGESRHILIGAFEEELMLGCCMLIEEDPQTVRLRQMAVYNEKQGKGIGRALMNFAETLARDRGYKLLTMHARKDAQGFYEKMGYQVSGQEFNEISIPHLIMQKKLS